MYVIDCHILQHFTKRINDKVMFISYQQDNDFLYVIKEWYIKEWYPFTYIPHAAWSGTPRSLYNYGMTDVKERLGKWIKEAVWSIIKPSDLYQIFRKC